MNSKVEEVVCVWKVKVDPLRLMLIWKAEPRRGKTDALCRLFRSGNGRV